jgi:hypothetical protein
MSDWIGLGLIVLVVVIALVVSARFGAPPRKISVEEFEERARSGGYPRAGMFGLQQLLHPKAVKAIEIQQDLKHGYYNKKKVPGEGDDEMEVDNVANTKDETNARDANVTVADEVEASGEVLNQTKNEERDA